MPSGPDNIPTSSFSSASLPKRLTGHNGSYMHWILQLRPLSRWDRNKGSVSRFVLTCPDADFTNSVLFENLMFGGSVVSTVLHAPVSQSSVMGCPLTCTIMVGLCSEPRSNCSMLYTSLSSLSLGSGFKASHLPPLSLSSLLSSRCLCLHSRAKCPSLPQL